MSGNALSRVAPLGLLGIPSAALRLPRVAPLGLLGIPSAALRLRTRAAWSFVAECRLGAGGILSEQIETPSNSDSP
jgi:hypothetical protein